MLTLKRTTPDKATVSYAQHLRAFSNHYSIVVHFLDDNERTFFIDRRAKGIDLLNEIFTYLDLANERKYFGLLIEDSTQEFSYQWLDVTKILKKQLTKNLSSYHLYLKVRFFPTNPSRQIDDEFTKYLFVLQIKKDLLCGKLRCSRSVAAILASYIIQSELGDYDPNVRRPGYLNDFHFVPFQNVGFENDVQQYHKQHRGQSSADAENNYLRVASSLDMYGVELHKTSVKISDTSNSTHNSVVELYIGVGAIGISVFQNSTKINIFTWDQITKLSFKRRSFHVQLNSSHDNSIVFTLHNYRCCKYLWKSCVDHHTFFRLSPIPSSSKFLQFKKKVRHDDILPIESLKETTEKKRKIFERVSNRRNIRSTNVSSTLPISSNKNYFLINKNLNLKTITSRSTTNLAIPKLEKFFSNQSSGPPKPPRQPYRLSFIQDAMVEANEYKPRNVMLSLTACPESPQVTRENLLLNKSPFSNAMSYIQPNYILIKLKADNDGRYGFTIKRKENQKTSTVVSKIALNTPASRALLREGDIILAINNNDIRDHSYEEIISTIRHSSELELFIKKNSLEESLQTLRNDLLSGRLVQQYEMLPRRKEGFTFEIGNNQYNYYHNRYKDVLPYDQTRIVLKTNSENDYINASYIDIPIPLTDTINRYIATQGPLPTTCESFWRMIWEQECAIIIMLTTLFESGRTKCHQYWPNVSETTDYGLFSIRCCREKKDNELIYREFLFLNKELNEKRIIYQIQSETWPDHGVPNDYASFVDFVIEIRELRKAKKHVPILVHCSAGIGRTGVLILMETALCLMETNQAILPLNTVQQMREQRIGMIQTASQYKFGCEAILYAYDHGFIEMNENE